MKILLTHSRLWHALESWVRGHPGLLKITPFVRSHASCCRRSTVTVALSCIVCGIKRDIGRKCDFFIPHLHASFDALVNGAYFVTVFRTEKKLE